MSSGTLANKVTVLPADFEVLKNHIRQNEPQLPFFDGKDELKKQCVILVDPVKKEALFRYYPEDYEMFTDLRQSEIMQNISGHGKYTKFKK